MNRRRFVSLAASALFPLPELQNLSLIDAMDGPSFRLLGEKGRMEPVAGRAGGGAVRFAFDEGASGTFFTRALRDTAAWDAAEGFSFWIRGEGPETWGGLQLIYAEDYAARYDFAFPVGGSEWRKVTVAWDDLIPVLPAPGAKPLAPGQNRPSRFSSLAFGKWWYWRDYPAQVFSVDDIRLEAKVPHNRKDYRPSGPPLRRTLDKLRAGKPVTIVTMGDSLTDYRHWANREVAWPRLLRDRLQKEFRAQVTVVNPAIGGTQLRQNLVLMPRWLKETPEPDLVTILFGYNDWDAGMRGPMFRDSCALAVDRVRRATKGRAEVLLLTTAPAVKRWDEMRELGEGVRKAASDRRAGLGDVEQALREVGREDRTAAFAWDATHLGPRGHEAVAQTVFNAIETAGRGGTK